MLVFLLFPIEALAAALDWAFWEPSSALSLWVGPQTFINGEYMDFCVRCRLLASKSGSHAAWNAEEWRRLTCILYYVVTSTKSSRCMCSISANSRTLHRDTGRAHTSCTHFNWIFELMSSLRSSYALYRDTMPLKLSNVHILLMLPSASVSAVNMSMLIVLWHTHTRLVENG